MLAYIPPQITEDCVVYNQPVYFINQKETQLKLHLLTELEA